MSIPKGYKLVPVETLKFALGLTRHGFKNRTDQEADKCAALKTITELLDAPTPPQPIYDEAAELEKFSTHWMLEGRIYRDKNTKQWLPTRDSIEGFRMAERVHALWIGWYSCAQSRAKAVEVGHE